MLLRISLVEIWHLTTSDKTGALSKRGVESLREYILIYILSLRYGGNIFIFNKIVKAVMKDRNTDFEVREVRKHCLTQN